VYGKILWMSLSQLFEIFIAIWMFSCSRARKKWAIVCKTTILVILVPFEWGMGLNDWIGRVVFALGSNRSRALVKMKDLKKVN